MADEEKVLPVKKALEENYSENLSDQDAINNLEEEEVKDVFDQIEALLRNEDPTAVHKFRDAGLLVNTIFDKKTDKEARRIVNEMARTKYLNAKVLYAARKFALEFTPAQVEYVAELYNPERRLRVDQTHLQYVMMDYISSTEERIKYLERAVREGMKPLTMYAIIKEDYERVPTGGAKHKVPNSPEALLLEINESCTKILRKMEKSKLGRQRRKLRRIYNRERVGRYKPGTTAESLRSWKANAMRGNTWFIQLKMNSYYQRMEETYNG